MPEKQKLIKKKIKNRLAIKNEVKLTNEEKKKRRSVKGKYKRIKKTNMKDGILFRLLYSQLGESKGDVAKKMNWRSDRYINTSNYTRREQQIGSEIYVGLNRTISKFQDKHLKYNKNVCAVDGTRFNVSANPFSKIFDVNPNGETCSPLILGIYNITRGSVISYDIRTDKNERIAFADFLKNNPDYLKDHPNTIFVFDRGFYSEEMVEICNEYNICYIFRLKKNALLLSLKENQINENNE